MKVQGKILGIIIFFAVISFNSCGGSSSHSEAANNSANNSPGSVSDLIAPVPGNSGTITVGSITASSLVLNWDASSDAGTTQVNLQYAVFKSSSNNLTSVANCENNGIKIQDYSAALLTKTVTGLTANTPYYFNIVVRDSSGNKAAYTVKQQTTNARVWGTPSLIETNTGNVLDSYQLSIDSSGNGIAVWSQSDGTHWHLWSNRYTVGTGWGTAVLIESNTSDATSSHIAIDSSGNAIAIWQQFNNSGSHIWANRYTVGAGWGTAVPIESNTGDATSPQIAIDSSGNGIAVWSQSDGTRYNIWSNRYTAGSGWGTATLIETNDVKDASYPKIAIDSSGNAIAVWQQFFANGQSNIWSNRYIVGTGWGIASFIESNAYGSCSPNIAIDSSGNAIVVWKQFVSSTMIFANIYANRYVAGTGWGTAVLLTSAAGDADDPQIAIDSSGNAIAVWSQLDGANYNILTNRYVAGTGWGSAVIIESNSGHAVNPQIAIDSSGNAIAVWSQEDGIRRNILANRYTIGTGWATSFLIESNNEDASYPQISINSLGDAFVLWQHNDGTRNNIWANTYR